MGFCRSVLTGCTLATPDVYPDVYVNSRLQTIMQTHLLTIVMYIYVRV